MRRLSFAALLVVPGLPAFAGDGPAKVVPTVDPLGSVTAVTIYAADADADTSAWVPTAEPYARRAATPGVPMKYFVVLPPNANAWRVGLTVRRAGGAAGNSVFDIGVGDAVVETLAVSPSADAYETYWSPLGRFGGAITVTVTPRAGDDGWTDVAVGAIQLATDSALPGSPNTGTSPQTTLTRRTSGPRGGGGGNRAGGGGGGGGGTPDPPPGPFAEILEEPPPVPPEPEDIPPAPEPEPGPGPGPRTSTPPPSAPAPGAVSLGLLTGAFGLGRRSRRQSR